jgi:hypothetical protein
MPPRKAIPKKQQQSASIYRAEALTRLKQRVEAEERTFDPSNEPVITPLLKQSEGGIAHILTALRAHDNEDARKFITLHDSLTAKDRLYLTLEEIAHACGIGALRLAEVATSAVIVNGQMATSLRIWSSADKIVKKSIKMAMTTRGVADREWALKHINYIPLPKGAQINIATQFNQNSKPQESQRETVYLDTGERLRAIHEAVEQRRLPAPPAEAMVMGDDIEHIQNDTADILNAEYE